jgi:hypothetical protein
MDGKHSLRNVKDVFEIEYVTHIILKAQCFLVRVGYLQK